MTIRSELASAVYEAMYEGPGCRMVDAERAADAVLGVLGGIDGSVDPELLAAHLKADRDEIARLRAVIAATVERDQVHLLEGFASHELPCGGRALDSRCGRRVTQVAIREFVTCLECRAT